MRLVNQTLLMRRFQNVNVFINQFHFVHTTSRTHDVVCMCFAFQHVSLLLFIEYLCDCQLDVVIEDDIFFFKDCAGRVCKVYKNKTYHLSLNKLLLTSTSEYNLSCDR